MHRLSSVRKMIGHISGFEKLAVLQEVVLVWYPIMGTSDLIPIS